MKSAKKELSPKEREELLKVLKARFEKNMNRHKGLEWARVQAKLEGNGEKLWSLNEMERPVVNRMLSVRIKRLASTSFLIVHRKLPKVARAFVTIVKGWNRGRNIDRRIRRWTWPSPWG